MPLFGRKSKSASVTESRSEVSRPPQPSQPFDYSRYPEEKIFNPGGYPVHPPPLPSTWNNNASSQYGFTHQSPPPSQQPYQQPSQQSAYHTDSHFNQQHRPDSTHYQTTHQPLRYSAPSSRYAHPSAYQGSPNSYQQQQQQQQQQVEVNVVLNPQASSYSSQPQQRSQYPQRQRQSSQGIPLCDAGHECERHTVKDVKSKNKGRLFWRCRHCNRFVVFDDER